MRAKNRTDDDIPPGGKTLGGVVSATVEFALSRGFAIKDIEAATGIGGLDLIAPDARLPDAVLPDLWKMLLAHARPGENLSLEMARAAPFSFLGGLAHGARFAATLRDALNLIIENQQILSDQLELILQESEEEAVIVARHPMDKLSWELSGEVGMALIHRLISEELDIHGSIVRVEFLHPPHGIADEYQQFFGATVLFEQPRNALIFAKDALTSPVKHANADLFVYVSRHFEQCKKRLAQNTPPNKLQKLRSAIMENAERGNYSPAAAAARAGLSLRSAQRLTSDHETSLQIMVDEVRASNAKEFLNNPRVSVETVSRLVGYTEDRAFRRAFKRWTGQTPSQFRKQY